MGAALGGHLRTAALLAERGADLNAASRTGHTPLMPAALKGNKVRVCPSGHLSPALVTPCLSLCLSLGASLGVSLC